MMTKEVKELYPTKPDKDGYFFETKDQQEMGIHSKVYENGAQIKKVTLKDGRTAVLRELKGKDAVNAKKWIQTDSSIDSETAFLSQALTVDGEALPPDVILEFPFKDYTLVNAAHALLNFL